MTKHLRTFGLTAVVALGLAAAPQAPASAAPKG